MHSYISLQTYKTRTHAHTHTHTHPPSSEDILPRFGRIIAVVIDGVAVRRGPVAWLGATTPVLAYVVEDKSVPDRHAGEK